MNFFSKVSYKENANLFNGMKDCGNEWFFFSKLIFKISIAASIFKFKEENTAVPFAFWFPRSLATLADEWARTRLFPFRFLFLFLFFCFFSRMKSRKKERRWERKGKQQQQQQKQQQQQQNQQQQQQQKRGTQRTTRAQGRAPQRRSVRARAGAARSVSRVADSDDETRAAISGLDRHLNFCSVFFFAFRADRIRSCRVSEIIGIIERDRLGGFRYAKKKNKQKIIAHMEVAERRNRSATAWWPLAWRIWETRYNSVRAASRSDTGPSEFSWRPVEKKKKSSVPAAAAPMKRPRGETR